MTPLNHAEAHERLADLALEPGALDRLGSPDVDPLAAHVAGCEACTREVGAWRRTAARLAAARGVGEERVDLATLAGDDPISPPAALRAQVLEAARATSRGVPVPAAQPAPIDRRPRAASLPLRFLPLAAVFAAILVAGGLVLERQSQLDAAAADVARLEAATATMDRILRSDHVVLALVDSSGAVGGSLSWSRHDIAIVTSALAEPAADRIYRCWIERDGVRSPVGRMFFAGATGYWTGSLDDWAEISFDGGTFGISLEPAEGAPDGNAPVLTADLEG